jgi:hypothetical protein
LTTRCIGWKLSVTYVNCYPTLFILRRRRIEIYKCYEVADINPATHKPKTMEGPLKPNLYLRVASIPIAIDSSCVSEMIIAGMIAKEGRSNLYKDVQLIIVYFIMGMMLYFIPAV